MGTSFFYSVSLLQNLVACNPPMRENSAFNLILSLAIKIQAVTKMFFLRFFTIFLAADTVTLYTLFFISTPFFWLSLDVLIFWAISSSNVLNGVPQKLRLGMFLAMFFFFGYFSLDVLTKEVLIKKRV